MARTLAPDATRRALGPRAVALLRRGARGGSPDAMFALAEAYRLGDGVPRDERRALRWLRKAADLGDPKALVALGRLFYGPFVHIEPDPDDPWRLSSRLVARDTRAAYRCFVRAAEQGDDAGLGEYGWCLLRGLGVRRNARKGLRRLFRAARNGDAEAWWTLVAAYRYGWGVPKSPRRGLAIVREWWRRTHAAEAANQGAFCCEDLGDAAGEARWHRRAAEAGHANCMVAYGYCLRYGITVGRDLRAAARWYRRAADLGDWEAWMNLAICHKNGEGVPKDPAKEKHCLERAAALGSDRAKAWLAAALADGRFGEEDPLAAEAAFRALAPSYEDAAEELADRLLAGDGVRQDVAEALRIYRRYARRDAPWAWLALGVARFNGRYVPKDIAGAVRRYRRAAKLGSARAWHNLGLCHRDGDGVPQSAARAMRCFEKAASLGDGDAAVVVARHLLDCDPARRDPRRAAEVLRSPVLELEHPEVLVLLARLHRDGDGVRRNRAKARELLGLAALHGRDVRAELRAIAAPRAASRRRGAGRSLASRPICPVHADPRDTVSAGRS